MFILRRVTSEGHESNQVIGESYNLTHSIYNEEEFKEKMEILKYPSEEEIFSFITFKGGSEALPLYKKSNYYMMTDSGKTFANLSLR